MLLHRIETGEIFVARQEKVDNFKNNFLKKEAENKIWVVTSEANLGGIGKSVFARRLMKICKNNNKILTHKKGVIDFIENRSRNELGILIQLAGILKYTGIVKEEKFTEFAKIETQYSKTQTGISELENLKVKAFNLFSKLYKEFIKELETKHNDKLFVLFFDTYEYIQIIEENKEKKNEKNVKSTDLSKWFETKLLPFLITESKSYTRIIIAGRHELINLNNLYHEPIDLSKFKHNDVKEYFKESLIKLKIKNDENIDADKIKQYNEKRPFINIHEFEEWEKINELDEIKYEVISNITEGKPILIALLTDYILHNYNNNNKYIANLLKEVIFENKEINVEKAENLYYKYKFKEKLISEIKSFCEPEYSVILYIAIAHHRLTPELLAKLMNSEVDYAIELLENIKLLSFIKTNPYERNVYIKYDKETNKEIEIQSKVYRLHDEIYDIMTEFVIYNENDKKYKIYKKDIQKNIDYNNEVKNYNKKTKNDTWNYPIKENKTDNEIEKYNSNVVDFNNLKDLELENYNKSLNTITNHYDTDFIPYQTRLNKEVYLIEKFDYKINVFNTKKEPNNTEKAFRDYRLNYQVAQTETISEFANRVLEIGEKFFNKHYSNNFFYIEKNNIDKLKNELNQKKISKEDINKIIEILLIPRTIKILNKEFFKEFKDESQNYFEIIENNKYIKKENRFLNIKFSEIPLYRIEKSLIRTDTDIVDFEKKLNKKITYRNLSNDELFYLSARLKYYKGEYHLLQSEFDDSEKFLYESHNDFINYAENNFWIHKTTYVIGYYYYKISNFKQAYKWSLKALTIFSDYIVNEINSSRDKKEKEIIVRKTLNEFQYLIRNIARIYRYMGQFSKAAYFGELSLSFSDSTDEIAQSQEIIGHALTYTQRQNEAKTTIDSTIQKFEKMAENTYETASKIRAQIVNARLIYQKNYGHAVEYYRSKDIIELITKINQEEIKHAEDILKSLTEVKDIEKVKEKGDVHYWLGELLVLQEKFKEAEIEFENAVKYANKYKFEHLEIDALESLFTLYYFKHGWLKIKNKTDLINNDNYKEYKTEYDIEKDIINAEDSFHKKKDELTKNNRIEKYPDIYTKFLITLGDYFFDRGIELIDTQRYNRWKRGKEDFSEAFNNYILAIKLSKKFDENIYNEYITIFYLRIREIIRNFKDRKELNKLNAIKELYKNNGFEKDFIEFLDNICDYSLAILSEEEDQTAIYKQLNSKTANLIEFGQHIKLAILNSAIIDIKKSNLEDEKTENNLETLIFAYYETIYWYQLLGNEFLVNEYLLEIDDILKQKTQYFNNIETYKAIINIAKAVALYRKGEYSILIEAFLSDELEQVLQDYKNREKVLGEEKNIESENPENLRKSQDFLENSITILQHKIGTKNIEDFEKNPEKINEWTKQNKILIKYLKVYIEAKFRLGELFALTQNFDKAIENLQTASSKYIKSFDELKYYDALQSLATIFYFSKAPIYKELKENPENKILLQELKEIDKNKEKIEKILLEEFENSNFLTKNLIKGKTLITIADNIFSEYISVEKDNYNLRKLEINKSELSKMLFKYIEAMVLLKEYNTSNYEMANRILLRRIQYIPAIAIFNQFEIIPSIWLRNNELAEDDEGLNLITSFIKLHKLKILANKFTTTKLF